MHHTREADFLKVSDIIPPLTAYEYRGYVIGAWARLELTSGFTSVGIVYKRSRPELMSQVQRIEGELFESKKHAERHGIELCKEWIDDNQATTKK
jgi:hypothetical protein